LLAYQTEKEIAQIILEILKVHFHFINLYSEELTIKLINNKVQVL